MLTVSLTDDERAKMDAFYANVSNQNGPPIAPGRTTVFSSTNLLEEMMYSRPPELRHVWSAEVGEYFLQDCRALPTGIQECALRNVAALLCTKYPGGVGTDTGVYGLLACEIGMRYHIIYEFVPRYHVLMLHFVRRADDAYDGPLRVVTPEHTPDWPDYDESYGETIGRSYECDMEKEDLRRIIRERCG